MAMTKEQRVERSIVRRLILDAIDAGYSINISNGPDFKVFTNPSRNAKEILAAMFTVGDEALFFYNRGANEVYGWVRFIYGNEGWDVINDHTTNLEAVMAGANRLADRYGLEAR